jgi:hypothetical protein
VASYSRPGLAGICQSYLSDHSWNSIIMLIERAQVQTLV